MSADSPNVDEKMNRCAHTFEASSDHGTVLKPEESAIIVDEEGQMYMLTRHREDENLAEVSRLELFLAAVFLKCDDEEWMDDMIEEYFGADSDVAGHC